MFDLHVSSPQSLLRLLSKRANVNLPLGLKNRLTSSGYVIHHEMLSSMSAHVLRELSDYKKLTRAGDLKSMSSKTVLLGLSIFRCGSERSVHGRLSWELATYHHESERTKDFTVWCRDTSTGCCFNERAGECGLVRFTSQFFFVLDKSKSIPIRIGGQTA